MGTRCRPKPQRLPAKLLEIRQTLRMSQSELIQALKIKTTDARISEYEHGIREPNLLVLLAYARLAQIPLEHILDDDKDLR